MRLTRRILNGAVNQLRSIGFDRDRATVSR
jgi:hypothetical protein